MIKCWREDPHERPEFIELVKTIEEMLGVGLDYLDLSCLTSVTNQEYFMNPDSMPPNAKGKLNFSSNILKFSYWKIFESRSTATTSMG